MRQKLVKFLPADAVSYDDASNNRALISGKSALIWNPPSAWAVAKRDAPQVAADCWTFPAPKGPKGRFVPYWPSFWGVWQFSRNKTAAKELIEYLMRARAGGGALHGRRGLRHPAVRQHAGLQGVGEVEPPKGTLYSTIRCGRASWTSSRTSPAIPAPPDIAVQIYQRGTMPTMLAKLQQRPVDRAGDRLGEGGAGGLQPVGTRLPVCACPSWPSAEAKGDLHPVHGMGIPAARK